MVKAIPAATVLTLVILPAFGGSEAAFCCICWPATDDDSFPSRDSRLPEGVTRFLSNQPEE